MLDKFLELLQYAKMGMPYMQKGITGMVKAMLGQK